MQSETKKCQNCKQDFKIEPEDFNFYNKMQVPPPTFCPECRLANLMMFRNERSLYKRKNNAPSNMKEVFSMYAPESPYIVFDKEYWRGDNWNPLDYGKEYDLTKSFFEQYKELFKSIPLPATQNMNSVNSPYSNYTDDLKNCYLVFGSGFSENTRYANRIHYTKDSQDLITSSHNELCFDLVDCHGCFKLVSGKNCQSCLNSFYLFNCKNCQNCFGCANIFNKSYCFFNEQLSKGEYEDRIKSLNLSSFKNIQKLEKIYEKQILKTAITKFANIVQSIDCTGHNINKSKNCKKCFDIAENGEDIKYVIHSLYIKNNYDVYGNYKVELGYQAVDNDNGMDNIGTITVYSSNNCTYCFSCQNSSNLLGCIGLRGNKNCILNKQYSEEEYKVLRRKIINHMNDMPYIDSKGRIYKYGEFFPSELSPFCYNETIAQEYFPLTKEEALKQGYKWKEKESRNYQIDIYNKDIPDDISDVEETIIGKVIECAHEGKCEEQCVGGFRLTSNELLFYRRLNIPIPKFCSNCRYSQRLKYRNPIRLWHRQCMCEKEGHEHTGKCLNEFETSYAPDRPEIVYCEGCYNKEVY